MSRQVDVNLLLGRYTTNRIEVKPTQSSSNQVFQKPIKAPISSLHHHLLCVPLLVGCPFQKIQPAGKISYLQSGGSRHGC